MGSGPDLISFSRKSAHYQPSGGQKTYKNQPKLRFPDANVKSLRQSTSNLALTIMGLGSDLISFTRKSAHYRPYGGQKTYENQPKLTVFERQCKTFLTKGLLTIAFMGTICRTDLQVWAPSHKRPFFKMAA